MTEDEHIERHLQIVQQVYERLVAEGKWSDLKLSDDTHDTAGSAS